MDHLLTSAEIQELSDFISLLLFSVGFSVAILGFLFGWYFRVRYESWYLCKHGATLDFHNEANKGQGVNQ